MTILRRAFDQEEYIIRQRVPCDGGIVIVFDEPARFLARRIAQRIHYLMQQNQIYSDAEHQTFDEFQYEIRMCGIRLLGDTLILKE